MGQLTLCITYNRNTSAYSFSLLGSISLRAPIFHGNHIEAIHIADSVDAADAPYTISWVPYPRWFSQGFL